MSNSRPSAMTTASVLQQSYNLPPLPPQSVMATFTHKWHTRDIGRDLRSHRLRAPLLAAGVGLFFWQGVPGLGSSELGRGGDRTDFCFAALRIIVVVPTL
jgi:hypothetical protein